MKNGDYCWLLANNWLTGSWMKNWVMNNLMNEDLRNWWRERMLQSQRFQIGLTNFHPLRNELPRNRFMGSPFSQCKLFVETELENWTVNDSLLSKRITSQQALSFGVPTIIFSTILQRRQQNLTKSVLTTNFQDPISQRWGKGSSSFISKN